MKTKVDDLAFLGGCGIVALYVVLWLCAAGAVVYVVVHFVKKFW